MKLDAQKIESIRQYLQNQPVLKAYLFGSYVSGEADERSDVDLLVELDYSQKIGLQFVTMKQDLENLLHKKVDLVSSNGISPYILPFVQNQKQLIYAKQA